MLTKQIHARKNKLFVFLKSKTGKQKRLAIKYTILLTKKQQHRREKVRKEVGVLPHVAGYCINSLMDTRTTLR